MAPRRREAAGAGQARRRDRRPRLPQGAIWSRTRRSRGRDHRKAFWTYTTAEDVLREINGYAVRDNPETGLKKGDLVRKVSDLKADGSTSSGAWIYAGVFASGENLSKRRDSVTDPGGLGLYPGFGWTWPNNMRILYNRASCDRTASPIRARNPSSGGTSRRSAGRDTTCRTFPSRPTAPTRRTVSGLPPGRGGRRTPLRGRLLGPRPEVPIIGATWPTCRRTARCRRCTSPSRARWKTSFTRA